MKKLAQILWPLSILALVSITPSCGGKGDEGSGDGDGDATTGGNNAGDGDGDSTGGTDGDGDGDAGGNGGGGAANASCDEACTNDDDPCTEDVCNPETGECGIPRTGNACDDGIYCNGADTCDDGACTAHEGDPCSDTSCNEGKNACECSQVEHCPGGDISGDEFGADGEWGTVTKGASCTYDAQCDQDCACAVTKSTYECVSGSCEPTIDNTIDPTCGTRGTEDTACTDDLNDCNGVETCQNGNCSPDTSTEPDCDGATPHCRDGNMTSTCVECLETTDCSGTDFCCKGACVAQGTVCNIIIQTLVSNAIISTLATKIGP